MIKKIISLLYSVLKKKKVFLFISAMLTLSFGLCGYMLHPDVNDWRVVIKTFGLFALGIEDKSNIYLLIAETFAIITLFLGITILFFKDFINEVMINISQKSSYSLLIGLGTQNSAYLDSIKGKEISTLVVESNINNSKIEEYRDKGFGVIVNQAEDVIDKLKLEMLQNTVISTGNDRQNIAIAIGLMKKLIKMKSENDKKIFVRIENRDLSVLFKQNVIKTSTSVDVIPYSLYENMTKELFSKHGILGIQPELINSNKTYNIVLVGSSVLATEIIYHLVLLANLPEENKLNLYLVDADVQKFYLHVKKLFASIESIPHLNIKPLELDSDTLEFYSDKVWNKRNLTNIFIATDDEEKNLDIAINLQDTTYPEQTVYGTFKTKVLLAIYNNLGLGREIDEDKKSFANFYTFADILKASSPKNLINEELDIVAKLIHNAYLGENEISDKSLNTKWMSKKDSSPHKRASNRAQALHIDTKLLALGLKREESSKDLNKVLKLNKKIFHEIFEKKDIVKKFPKIFDTPLSKLARSEHNRWNAFHYLYGWKYSVNRSDEAKRHPCLLAFSEFNTDELRDTYQWDVDAVLNIPVYLAHAGYELIEAE